MPFWNKSLSKHSPPCSSSEHFTCGTRPVMYKKRVAKCQPWQDWWRFFFVFFQTMLTARKEARNLLSIRYQLIYCASDLVVNVRVLTIAGENRPQPCTDSTLGDIISCFSQLDRSHACKVLGSCSVHSCS